MLTAADDDVVMFHDAQSCGDRFDLFGHLDIFSGGLWIAAWVVILRISVGAWSSTARFVTADKPDFS